MHRHPRQTSSKEAVTMFGAVCLALAPGCTCGDGGTGGRDTGGGGRDAAEPRAVDANMVDAARDATSAEDAGAPADAGIDGGRPPLPGPVRFVVMGDTGEGNASQRAVGVQIRDLCAAEGCDFVLLLGDNIYDSGVESVDDPLWMTHFEDPYRDISLPFYAVLGNHDYGGTLFLAEMGGLGNEFEKGPIEVMYTARSERWTMPATFYTLQMENVGFVMLDTNSILWDDVTNGDQRAWYAGAVEDLRAAGAEWIIVSGHHPYRSNGRHGDAGSYESIEVAGVEVPNPVPLLNGMNVRRFFDDEVCGTADVVFAGHDHNRQWLDEPTALCGAELIVSGAGSKTTGFESTSNTTLFQDDMTPGFMYVVIEGDRMIGRFVDETGRVDFENEIMRRP